MLPHVGEVQRMYFFLIITATNVVVKNSGRIIHEGNSGIIKVFVANSSIASRVNGD